MDGQLARPRMQRMSGTKVHEGDCEQSRTHRRKHSRCFLPLLAVPLRRESYQGSTCKACKTNSDQKQGFALVIPARISDLPQVHGNRQEAQRVAGSDNWTKLAIERKIKENSGEQAQN